MKLAILDLDGVVIDASARFARADEVKATYLRGDDVPYSGSGSTDVYWRAALDPDFVHLDTLIDGAREAIARLEQEEPACWQILYLTSRPEAMREATEAWLEAQQINGPKLIMKAPAFQYVKTPVWKAGMVETLVRFYRADEILYVDDETFHYQEVQRHLPDVKCYPSLAAVFAALDESDPFLPDFPD